MSRLVAFRALSIVHVLLGLLLLIPGSWLLGLLFAPILASGAMWIVVLGVRLWTPGAQVITSLRRTHSVSVVIGVLLVAYGLLALQAAERSAARGGGLLGGFGLIPLGLGILLSLVATSSLLLAAISPRDR